jgi:hypothetical protein
MMMMMMRFCGYVGIVVYNHDDDKLFITISYLCVLLLGAHKWKQVNKKKRKHVLLKSLGNDVGAV